MIKKCHMKKHIKGAAWYDDECKKAKKESKEKLKKILEEHGNQIIGKSMQTQTKGTDA